MEITRCLMYVCSQKTKISTRKTDSFKMLPTYDLRKYISGKGDIIKEFLR